MRTESFDTSRAPEEPQRPLRANRIAADSAGILERMRAANSRITRRQRASALPQVEAGLDQQIGAAAVGNEILREVRANPEIALDPGWWQQRWPARARADVWDAAAIDDTTFLLRDPRLRQAAVTRVIETIEEAVVRTCEIRDALAAMHLVLTETHEVPN